LYHPSKTLAFPTRPENDGIVIESSSGPRITVDRCDIQQNSGSGISASGSSNVTITECTIMNNGTSPRGGSGVSVNGGTKDIHVTGNHISDRRGVSNPGIKAGDASSLDSGGQVTNNTVLGFGAGVALGANSTEFVVEKNDLRKNTTCVTNDGTGNRVTDNLC
jgi:parallel beta-helix repeat protein